MDNQVLRIMLDPKTQPSELEQAVDTEIGHFDTFFQSLGNDPLVGAERAILKTFCWYLVHEGERVTVHDVGVKLEVVKIKG